LTSRSSLKMMPGAAQSSPKTQIFIVPPVLPTFQVTSAL